MSAVEPRLSALLDGAGVRPLEPVGTDPGIRGASLDSRQVSDGDLFFAVRGEVADGLGFVPQAVARGARAVVAAAARPRGLDSRVAWVRVEEPRRVAGPISREIYARPDEALTLVGITGTNGKTTVAYMVEAIAAAAGRRAGRIGTVGYAFAGVERQLARTTPEAPDLYRLLAQMRDQRVELVAMEVSSHSLSLGRVDGVRFAAAAFLNLSRDHLDFHGDEAGYFEAKASLFDRLDTRHHAVLPADAPWGERLRRRTRARVLTFGRSPRADVRLADERCTLDGSSARLATPRGTVELSIRLPGRFNLDNAAAAAACAVSLDLPLESVSTGLAELDRVPGRVERVDGGRAFAVLVDYAHTPDALSHLLGWVRELAAGRLLVVFGCGGNRDSGKRAEMGRVAAEHADVVYVTSDNPRDEDPAEIVAAVRAGAEAVAGKGRVNALVDRREAIDAAVSEARPGDVVVIAGKGHETTQTIAGRVEPFDDRVEAAVALDRRDTTGSRDA